MATRGSLLILRRGRAERSITYAAITIAVAMTINVDAVYRPIDALLGGSNVATLIGDCALMVGIFFLGRGIMKAGSISPDLSALRSAPLPSLLRWVASWSPSSSSTVALRRPTS